MTITFGKLKHEHLRIEVVSYERPPSGDHFDDNWLVVEISVSAGTFSGRTSASFLTFELVGFSEQLHTLYETLSGEAEFSTLEGQLQLKLNGDGRGHLALSGELAETSGQGSRLFFNRAIDQTQLHASLRELDAVIRAFPVRGT